MILSKVSLGLREKVMALSVSNEVNLVGKIAQRSEWIARWKQKQARFFCAPTGIHIVPTRIRRADALRAEDLMRFNSYQD